MPKVLKVFLFTVLLFVFISCGYEHKKHFPMPALNGLVVVVPFVVKLSTGIKKTGQSKSYDEYSDEVTDGSIKDDGFYQTGTAHDYTRNDTHKIVFDHTTRLAWQDNGDAKTLIMSWFDAKNYCEDLVMGPYSDWHLPEMSELKSILRYDKYNPSLDDAVFTNYDTVGFDVIIGYWSSTQMYDDLFLGIPISFSAWQVVFFSSNIAYRKKAIDGRVRCVNRSLSEN